jgi:hypothetical protein
VVSTLWSLEHFTKTSSCRSGSRLTAVFCLPSRVEEIQCHRTLQPQLSPIPYQHVPSAVVSLTGPAADSRLGLRSALDDHFGEHVDGDSRFLATDGGVAQARFDEGDVTDSGDGPSAVHSDDDPRTKRAKREDIELRAGLVPRPDGRLPEKARPNTQ